MTDQIKDYFKKNGYVHLAGVLPKEECQRLCQHMFHLYEAGKLVKDDQCPLSDSVYGNLEFDSLLEKLAKPIGEHLGLDLLPTYTYCRIYRPGEVLKRHSDRPSCEISGTMTLGFDADSGDVWPIYFAKDPNDTVGTRIDIPVGDLVMYRGEELIHWRPAFRGNWQIQVFFHYVDANGPHAAYEFDNRDKLGTSAESKHVNQKPTQVNKPQEQKQNLYGRFPIFGGVMIPSWDLDIPGPYTFGPRHMPDLAFTPEECEEIINFGRNSYPDPAAVGVGDNARVDTKIRDVDVYRLPLNDKYKWVFDRIARAVSVANDQFYRFEIMGITHELQLLHYKTVDGRAGHYDWHVDIGGIESATRKISASVQLSESNSYQGGNLVLNNHGEIVTSPRDRGSITMFPSYMSHRVEPMVSGERWALVIWVHGSHRFR